MNDSFVFEPFMFFFVPGLQRHADPGGHVIVSLTNRSPPAQQLINQVMFVCLSYRSLLEIILIINDCHIHKANKMHAFTEGFVGII